MKLKMKALIYLVFLGISQVLFRCSDSSNHSNVIEVQDGGKPLKRMMYLNKKHWTMGIIIKENTLNDTAMLGGNLSIPPGKVGLLMKGDCFMDSLPFIYQPYRATKGKLVVEYFSKGY